MLTGISLELFDIKANPAFGYGFSIFNFGYTVTHTMTSSKLMSLLGFNFEKSRLYDGAFDSLVWVGFLFTGTKFYVKRVRPTREDGIDYWKWYKQAKQELNYLHGTFSEYYESYAVSHYMQGLSPDEAAEQFYFGN